MGRPLWGRAAYTVVHSARLSSVPSGDRSANPATHGASGRSDLQRAYISVLSAREHNRPERPATPSGVSRAARSAVSCRCAVPGHRARRSGYTRCQSRETGFLSRLFGSMGTTAKCVSVGPAHCRERLQNPVRFSSASIQWGESHSGGPRAGSGNGKRGRYSLKEGGHQSGSSSRKRVQVLQPILHSSKEGWRVASHFRSASVWTAQSTDWSSRCSFSNRSCLGSGPRRVSHNQSKKRHTSISPSFPLTGSSSGLLSGAKLTNIGFFLSAWHSHPALLQSVWMLR